MVNGPFLLFVSGAPGSLEIIVVFIVILVLFGPKRLPGIARSVGQVLNQLRNASQDFKDQVMRIEEEATLDLEAEEIVDNAESHDGAEQADPDDLPDHLTPVPPADDDEPETKPEAS